MKLAVILSIALFTSPAMALDGSVRVAWTACPGNVGAAGGVLFDCDPLAHTSYRMLTTFTPRDPVQGVVGADGVVDFMMRDATAVPRFWHFESGACNASGLELQAGAPPVGCSGARADLCGAGGASCNADIASYVVGPGGGLPSHRARLVFTVMRAGASPVSLSAGLQQFGFELTFTMDHASPSLCGGCPEIVAISWLESTLLDAMGQPLARLDGTAPGSDATVYANCQACSIVRQRATSWGTIKALYR